MEATNTNNFDGNGRNGRKPVVIEKIMVANKQDFEVNTTSVAPSEAAFVAAPEEAKDSEQSSKANFKETQLENMKPGQVVEVKLDSFPHHTFKGRVDSLSPASGAQFALLPPDNATGNFTKIVQRIPVKIVFDPASIQGYDSRITPGMSAEVSVEVK